MCLMIGVLRSVGATNDLAETANKTKVIFMQPDQQTLNRDAAFFEYGCQARWSEVIAPSGGLTGGLKGTICKRFGSSSGLGFAFKVNFLTLGLAFDVLLGAAALAFAL